MSGTFAELRRDFAPLRAERPPIYLDNACVTLRPDPVAEAGAQYYREHPGCHRRAAHRFGLATSRRFDAAREAARAFLNAREAAEIVFTRNTTEGVNLVARSFPFCDGDAVVTTDAEHNSNFVPWRARAPGRRLVHRTVRVDPDGGFDLGELERALREGARLVSVFARSHILGRGLPVAEIVALAHRHGARVLVDAAQAALHERLDVRALDCDFLALSFHKMLGPSGFGLLYGKRERLEELSPFLVGGDAVDDVDEAGFTSAPLPARFEAGLQDYAGAMAAEAAVRYLERLDWRALPGHEAELNALIYDGLAGLGKVRLLGPRQAERRGSIVNFSVPGLDAGELSLLLDGAEGIMTRSGVHCAHAWYRRNGLPPTLRASLAFYNTRAEAEAFVAAIGNFVRYF